MLVAPTYCISRGHRSGAGAARAERSGPEKIMGHSRAASRADLTPFSRAPKEASERARARVSFFFSRVIVNIMINLIAPECGNDGIELRGWC